MSALLAMRARTALQVRVDIGCANCDANFKPDASGTCSVCDDSVAFTVTAAVLAVFVFLGITALYARMDTSRVRLATLSVGICVGQTAVAAQTLSVFSVLAVDWVEPIRQRDLLQGGSELHLEAGPS